MAEACVLVALVLAEVAVGVRSGNGKRGLLRAYLLLESWRFVDGVWDMVQLFSGSVGGEEMGATMCLGFCRRRGLAGWVVQSGVVVDPVVDAIPSAILETVRCLGFLSFHHRPAMTRDPFGGCASSWFCHGAVFGSDALREAVSGRCVGVSLRCMRGSSPSSKSCHRVGIWVPRACWCLPLPPLHLGRDEAAGSVGPLVHGCPAGEAASLRD